VLTYTRSPATAPAISITRHRCCLAHASRPALPRSRNIPWSVGRSSPRASTARVAKYESRADAKIGRQRLARACAARRGHPAARQVTVNFASRRPLRRQARTPQRLSVSLRSAISAARRVATDFGSHLVSFAICLRQFSGIYCTGDGGHSRVTTCPPGNRSVRRHLARLDVRRRRVECGRSR